MDQSKIDNIDAVGEKNVLGHNFKKLDFTSKIALAGGVAGLGYDIFSGKNKLIFTALGAISGAIIEYAYRKISDK